jgi:hypothetical protein
MHLVVDLLIEFADPLYGPSRPEIHRGLIELGTELLRRCLRLFDDRGGSLGGEGRDEGEN